MTPEQIKEKGLFPYPAASVPGPRRRGNALPQDDDRRPPRLTRFDLDFDLPEHVLPEKAPPIYPDDAAGSRRRLQGQGHHARELLRDLQRPPEPEAARRPAPPRHAVPPAAVQRHRGPPDGSRRRDDRGDLLRLPRERAHQQGHAPGRGHPAPGVPAPDQHPVAPRRERPAPLRIAARPQDGGGLHRVRAARRLFRRRPRHGGQEGGQRPGAGLAGPLHVRVHGPARLPARAEAEHLRRAGPGEGHSLRGARPGPLRREGPVLRLPSRAPTTPTTTCTTSRPSGSTSRPWRAA